MLRMGWHKGGGNGDSVCRSCNRGGQGSEGNSDESGGDGVTAITIQEDEVGTY